MTVVFASCCLALTLLFASFTSTLAHVSSLRTRAQLAADGAALAAAVEGTIAGSGSPEEQASAYAQMNGARLTACSCALGTPFVQVEVEIDGVRAEAKAAIDPSRLGPAAGVASLDPDLAAAVDELISAAKGRVQIGSGFRRHDEQEVLWQEALLRYGDPEIADDWVARPGTSFHERGLAVDLRGDLATAVRLIGELGLPLHSPLPNEPWHFELVGSRD
ncbi:MAG: zinc D-Ala-D-Ala carboxypeptidase [Actinomycetota bacterium]|nr:zinc D-Ala-D-Ala carboxypeptidase [Actinomycetota bacterium]